MWAGPQTAIHTHSKPPCDCVFHMPSRSPHITVCITMIHSQPTCDCAGNAENFDLFCFSRSIFIHNLHYYQVQLRPTNSPLENGKRVEHNVLLGVFGYFGGTENSTWGARIKIQRPLFNTNTPPKPPFRHLGNHFGPPKSDFQPFCTFC